MTVEVTRLGRTEYTAGIKVFFVTNALVTVTLFHSPILHQMLIFSALCNSVMHVKMCRCNKVCTTVLDYNDVCHRRFVMLRISVYPQ